MWFSSNYKDVASKSGVCLMSTVIKFYCLVYWFDVIVKLKRYDNVDWFFYWIGTLYTNIRNCTHILIHKTTISNWELMFWNRGMNCTNKQNRMYIRKICIFLVFMFKWQEILTGLDIYFFYCADWNNKIYLYFLLESIRKSGEMWK